MKKKAVAKEADAKSTQRTDEQEEAWRESLAGLQDRLRHRFKTRELLETALTHSSYANEHTGVRDNERLEFLGDAVLELVVREILYQEHHQDEEWDEGRLSRTTVQYVKNDQLAEQVKQLGIESCLRLGRGQQRRKPIPTKILADASEALLGALYLDGGLQAAYECIRRLYPDNRNTEDLGLRDPKTQLNERAHARKAASPKYKMLSDAGAEGSDERFTMAVFIADKQHGVGSGRTKQQAEQEAARKALVRLQTDA